MTRILQLLVSEQSHGRLLDVRFELPLELLDHVCVVGKSAGSTDRLLFDCINEALLLLTLGAEETTIALWQYRMTHLAEASVFASVCKALNRQLGAWLACAHTDDTRERLQRQLKCEIAAGECVWAASVKQHVAELHTADTTADSSG